MGHLMSLKIMNEYECFATLVALVFRFMNFMPFLIMTLKLRRVLEGFVTNIAYRHHDFFTLLFMTFKAVIENQSITIRAFAPGAVVRYQMAIHSFFRFGNITANVTSLGLFFLLMSSKVFRVFEFIATFRISTFTETLIFFRKLETHLQLYMTSHR